MRSENIVEAFINLVEEDLHHEKLSVALSDPRKYNREKSWLPFSRVDEITNLLHAILQ